MVKHPFVPNSKVFALAKKFNTFLEETIAGDCRSHILKPHVTLDDNNFDRNGNLSPEGLVTYWKVIDATMKDFNSGETKLQPKRKSGSSRAESHPAQVVPAHHRHGYSSNRFHWSKERRSSYHK